MNTWWHVLEWRGNCDAETPAMRWGPSEDASSMTYAQLLHAAERAAGGWADLGVSPGDRVLVVSHNSADLLVQTFALMRLGALPVLLNWRLTATEIRQLADRVTATAALADAAGADLLDRALADSPTDGLRVRVQTATPNTAPGVASVRGGWIPVADVVGEVPPRPVERLRADEPALLMHTSGTTGLPKVIPLDHGSLIRSLSAFALDIGDQERGDGHLLFMPLFHLAGLAQAMQCFLTGGTLRVEDGFDTDRAIDLLSTEPLHFFTAAPTIIEMLVNALEGPRAGTVLPHLKEVQYGAAPITPELLARATRVVAPRFRQIYGSTELQGFLTVLRPEDHRPGTARMASAGRLSPGWEARVVDPGGQVLDVGEVGELQARSELLINGYWNSPADTASAWTSDGWYRTGDLARVDAEGFVSIVGRAKEMIVSGGENVYPAEIERVLSQHPDVLEVAVVGVPDQRWGETPAAFLVLSEGADPEPTVASVQRHAREHLAGFKNPTRWETCTALPRNAVGKVLKQNLALTS